MYFLAVEHMSTDERAEFDALLNPRDTREDRAELIRRMGGDVA